MAFGFCYVLFGKIVMPRNIVFLLAALLLAFAHAVALAQTAASPDTATVIFYRPTDDGGRAYSLTHQNKELVKLKKGEQFEQKLAPGTYYYMADPASKQVFKLEVSAGNTYYIRASKDGNFFNGQPMLQVSTVQEYQQTLANNE
jgi:hypothetical protein